MNNIDLELKTIYIGTLFIAAIVTILTFIFFGIPKIIKYFANIYNNRYRDNPKLKIEEYEFEGVDNEREAKFKCKIEARGRNSVENYNIKYMGIIVGSGNRLDPNSPIFITISLPCHYNEAWFIQNNELNFVYNLKILYVDFNRNKFKTEQLIEYKTQPIHTNAFAKPKDLYVGKRMKWVNLLFDWLDGKLYETKKRKALKCKKCGAINDFKHKKYRQEYIILTCQECKSQWKFAKEHGSYRITDEYRQ